MHRTQICLEDWQYQALKSLSEETGESLANVLRGIVSRHLRGRRRTARNRLLAIEGIIADDEATGKQHDRFLYGAARGRA